MSRYYIVFIRRVLVGPWLVSSKEPQLYMWLESATWVESLESGPLDNACLFDFSLPWAAQKPVGNVHEDNIGSVNFSIFYHRDQSLFTVKLVQAIELVPGSRSKTAHPFARVSLLPEPTSPASESNTSEHTGASVRRGVRFRSVGKARHEEDGWDPPYSTPTMRNDVWGKSTCLSTKSILPKAAPLSGKASHSARRNPRYVMKFIRTCIFLNISPDCIPPFGHEMLSCGVRLRGINAHSVSPPVR